jgi:cellulose synthase/poly-beta-1,6-N-acetylglucosamine synthase-like glycosyltransferase
MPEHKHTSSEPALDTHRELALAGASLAATAAASALAARELAAAFAIALEEHHRAGVAGLLVVAGVTAFLVYGSVVYQLARLGWLRRLARHEPAPAEALDAIHDGQAPPVAILVPSYKEDPRVVLQTLLSAALQDYPNKRVVLLIDDPPEPRDDAEHDALVAARALPAQLRSRLREPAVRLEAARSAFERRLRAGAVDAAGEACALARLYRSAAAWCDREARATAVRGHADAFFVDFVLERLRDAHLARARRIASAAGAHELAELRREYARLAGLFAADVTSFERKRFANLSHEPNKAMNLNAYLALLGKRLCVRRVSGARCLVEAAQDELPDLAVPDARYVATLDADSLIASEYVSRLVDVMERPGNERIAVAQTPYSAFPGAPGALERVAGATTDIQRVIHQGFTAYAATYWVGANAVVRRSALEDIAVVGEERGYEVTRYVQDRTVIEDTESSVDLAANGWDLHNYPERLAYSATPPDFGSLVIQRRRWANGGLVIIPKLIAYLVRRRRSLAEATMRFHYLASITAVNVGLLFVLAFPLTRSELLWLPLTAVPYYGTYLRDLRLLGYRWGDVARVYALNLLLIPVNLSGIANSVHQVWTGRKIPFARTPKVEGRTAAAPGYVLAEYVLVAWWITGAAFDFAARRWMHGAFAAGNAAFLLFAIGAFIGFRESREDLLAPFRPPAALVAVPVPVASDGPPATESEPALAP